MQLDTWRKTCGWFAALLIAAGLVMFFRASFHGPIVPDALQNPGIAMELVRTCDEINSLANSRHNRRVFHELQIWDETLFIPAYLLFFGAGGIYLFKASSRPARWLGPLIVLIVAAAAAFDYLEDIAILAALRDLHNADADAISGPSYVKWKLLYAMSLCYIPFYLRRWHSATLRIVGVLFALAAALTGVEGLLACFVGFRPNVEAAAFGLFVPVLFFMPFLALFHHGAMDGLSWFARLPGLKQLTSWPDLKDPR